MKKLNVQKGRKLSRDAQKNISGGGLELQACASGCYDRYFSDGQGNCLVPPCSAPNFGSEIKEVDGRWKCCY
ncbi:hypothetical protein [Chryseobacterium indoltheticum]|uniref:Bacteriocin n=1 Tax=Chryseobacterium indoltheticum TaxID=254 RepID=A0A381FNN0_9FLAO|nr:hypothetical protein [Chryseobacterium indoltheticum]SUX48145.1 Uncharacterised protein [Chryseobacterium indoltheticum]